jgi:hypothetical protein
MTSFMHDPNQINKCKFNQNFMCSFYSQISQKCKKTVKSPVSFLLLGSSRVRAAVKLTPGVDFANILQAAFTRKNSKSTKDIENLTFLHFWDLWVWKLRVKMLVTLTPSVNFINVLRPFFV